LTELDFKRKATEFLKKGRYDDAIAQYQALIAKSKKKNPAILNLIGDIHVKQASYEQAFEAFLDAIRLYAEEELFHNGIAIGKKILRLDKDQVEVYSMLGNLYARQGLGMDAMKFLRVYAQRKEDSDEFPAALAAFAEACEILVDTPEVHVEYGQMLDRVGRKEDSAACYRNAAQIHTDKGQDDLAAPLLEKAGLRGGTDSEDSDAHDMSELMSLRTLDDTPRSKVQTKSESREQFWGRTDEPDGLTLESTGSAPAPPARTTKAPKPPAQTTKSATPPVRRPPAPAAEEDSPWIIYDPNANPAIPPPPPLPGAGAPTPVASAPTPTADPNDMFVEPGGISETVEADAKPQADAGLELELEPPSASIAPGGLQPAADDAPPLESLPGIVLPGSTSRPSAPAPPASTPSAKEPEAAPPAPDPSDSADAELAAFFDSAALGTHADQQAVVIGDDFELLREGGDVSEVIADFREATMEILDLDDFQAHYDLGTTYMEMELFDEAAAEFEIAARGESWALSSQEMLGYCFLRKGQIELAIRELERGLGVPGYEEGNRLGLLYNLGIAYGVLDKEEDAIANFQRILEVDPDFRDTRTRLERLVQSSG
jgi:tetratricopeptide (TPR) repeat protein